MRRIAFVLLAAIGTLTACELESPGTGGPVPSGPVCYVDEDCVPTDCCGEGNTVTHVSRAPACSGVECNTNCDPSMLSCGCGLPYCSDGRCVAAVTSC